MPVHRGGCLVLAALLGTGCSGSGAVPPDAGTPGLPVPAAAQPAVVVRVTDGDTVVLRGQGTGPLPGDPTRVRLLLVDTPETHGERECFGAEAAGRTAGLLPRGAAVRVEADVDRQDRFGRTLLHVWTDDGRNVGETLVAEGYATVLVVEPNERHLDRFRQRERQARGDRAGLWSACR